MGNPAFSSLRPRLCENLVGAMILLLNRREVMQGFIQGADRQQTTLLPECLDDWVDEGNSIRAVDVFVDALELRDLGFDGVENISSDILSLSQTQSG
jgi:hypothetical protein